MAKDEEKNEFGFQTDEEVGFVEEPVEDLGFAPEISQAEAFGKGIKQGATFGFAEELGGLAGAAGAKIAAPEVSQGQTIKNLLERYSRLKEKGAPPEVLEEMAGNIKELARMDKPKSFGEEYRGARDVLRGEYKAAEEQHPGTFLAGSLAGGIAVPVPGLGIAKAGKGALQAVKAGTKVAKEPLIKALAKSGAMGTGFGAAAGAGVSEADVTKGEFKEFGKDVATGSMLGGVLGTGLTATGRLATGTANKLMDLKPIQRAVDTFKASASGQKLSGQLKTLSEDMNEMVHWLTKDIREVYKGKGALRTEAIEQADKAGKIINVENDLRELKEEVMNLPRVAQDEKDDVTKLLMLIDDKLEDTVRIKKSFQEIPVGSAESKLAEKAALKRAEAETLKIPGEIKEQIVPTEIEGLGAGMVVREGKKGGIKKIAGVPIREGAPQTKVVTQRTPEIMPAKTDLTPSETLDMFQKFQKHTGYGDAPLKTREAQTLAGSGKAKMTKALGQEDVAPGFEKMTSELSDVMAHSETMFGKTPGEILKKSEYIPHLNKFKTFIKNFDSDADRQTAMDMMLNGYQMPESDQFVKGLKELAPELATEFEKQIQSLGKRYDLATAIDKSIENTSQFGRGILGGIQSVGLRGAEVAGSTVHGAKEMLHGGLKFLTGMPPERLQSLAQKGVAKYGEGFARHARALERAANMPRRSKNAILYGLMQQPTFRDKINELEQPEESGE